MLQQAVDPVEVFIVVKHVRKIYWEICKIIRGRSDFFSKWL